MSIKISPSKPFSNGMSYEFFLESFCYRCNKHKEREDGFCAFVEQGGCPIENAMEDAQFNIEVFPSDDVVQIEKDGEVLHWNICKTFETDDAELMNSYKQLFAEERVDAVEVVRCKDCMYFQAESGCPLHESGYFKNGKMLPLENDFCSYGERKTE